MTSQKNRADGQRSTAPTLKPGVLESSGESSCPKLVEWLRRAFPALNTVEQRVSLALYRCLAEGAPVSGRELAEAAAVEPAIANALLSRWPGVYLDKRDRVIGYWGLTIRPTRHSLKTDQRTLFTWCAWDLLFIPRLLQTTILARSNCMATGQPVELTVSPDRVESAGPVPPVLSFLMPEPEDVHRDVATVFCHHVHFFRSVECAEQWVRARPGMFVVSLAEAFEAGRQISIDRYSATLDPEAP